MVDRLINEQSANKIYALAEEFDIPVRGLTVDREGLIIPSHPMILFADSFLLAPPCELVDNPDVLREKWDELLKNVQNLIDPHTGFNPYEAHIRMSAIDTFTAGVILAHYLPDARIVLPLSVGFKPHSTPTKILEANGIKFKFNAWRPDTIEAETFLYPSGGKISRSSFTVLLKPPDGKLRENKIEFNLISRGKEDVY